MPLAPDTIEKLTDLALAACSTDPRNSARCWLDEAIDELLAADESFRAWAGHVSLEASAQSDPGSVPSPHISLPRSDVLGASSGGKLSDLLFQLARDASWITQDARVAAHNEPDSMPNPHVGGDSNEIPSPWQGPVARSASEQVRRAGEQRLWQVVQLGRRLETMESRFSHELELAKREAIYTLAYGLSHELNNPLANITARARVLAEQESDLSRKQMLAAIVDQAMRGSEMIADLMLVARPPKMKFVELDVQKLVREFVDRCRPWAEKRSVDVTFESNTSECFLEGDADSLRESLWCLVRNSLEAVAVGGRIDVGIRSLGHEKMVHIEIRDNGPGLSAEALNHCFDPYYSGRESGRGLGLGLAKAERIVSLHRGKLCISNCPAGGCAASIELPARYSESIAPAKVCNHE